MNKLPFLILITSFLLCGCEPESRPRVKDTQNKLTFEVIVVDGCQYLTSGMNRNRSAAVMTHKGNCTNSIHYK